MYVDVLKDFVLCDEATLEDGIIQTEATMNSEMDQDVQDALLLL
jgi:hypothetical protein